MGCTPRRRNIFDPEEDENAGEQSTPETIGTVTLPSIPSSTNAEAGEGDKLDSGESAVSGKNEEPSACARKGCSRKPRFDSVFCSDACGVSALESDLLRTFQYASDIHPSLLRN